MKVTNVLLPLFFLLPIMMFGGITGRYKESGYSPTFGHYTGTAVIKKVGLSYTATWTYSDGSIDVGTGVRQGNYLSFVYSSIDLATPLLSATQIYKIKGDILEGYWIYQNSTQRGFDKLKKIH